MPEIAAGEDCRRGRRGDRHGGDRAQQESETGAHAHRPSLEGGVKSVKGRTLNVMIFKRLKGFEPSTFCMASVGVGHGGGGGHPASQSRKPGVWGGLLRSAKSGSFTPDPSFSGQ